jgi:hypothetical protein
LFDGWPSVSGMFRCWFHVVDDSCRQTAARPELELYAVGIISATSEAGRRVFSYLQNRLFVTEESLEQLFR